tara:strand:+ start:1219 stop:2697 length:1479 start_codon:yes stop_codon:yes gene_type:complete
MKFIYTLLFLFFTLISFSQNTNLDLKGVDEKINNLIKQYDAIGLSVSVVKNGKIIYSKGFGYRDFEKKLLMTDNTLFPIASMTKAFTGSLLGILESKNQVSLKEKPSLYVPGLQFYNKKMDDLIAIEDLLCHNSGIGGQGTSLSFFPEKDKLKTVQRLKYLKPEAEIKNSFSYSNMGYTLVGTIVEQITDKSWDANIQEKLFEPLQMKATTTTIEKMIQSNNYSLGYAMYKGKTELVPFEDYYAFSPAGGIKSSTKDLTNWMRVWLNNGVYNKNQVIPKEYVNKATKLQNVKKNYADYEEDSFLKGEGFGWNLNAAYGYFRVRHGGNTNGFSTAMDLFPNEKIGIVVLVNQRGSLLPYLISDYILRKLHQLPTDFEYPINVRDMYKPKIEDEPLNKEKMPTHDLKDFTGSYYANGFGKIEVTEEKGKLFVILPTYKFKLEHLNYNSFYLKGMKGFKENMNPEYTIKFVVNTKGEISSLNMYSQKEPIEFNKE